MEELERFVVLSRGLTARVVGGGVDTFAGGFIQANAPRPESRALLRLEEHTGATPPDRQSDPAFRVDLRWQSATSAAFTVPGGAGTLALSDADPVQIEATLRVHPDEGRMAVETSLRLLLSLLLPTVGGLLVHASAVVIDGKAHVFMGHSGAGKTTTAHRLAAEGASVLAEDLLLVEGTRAEACRFDIAGRRVCEAGEGAHYPIAAAYLVHKHAETSQVPGLVAMPLRAWSEAIFSARLVGRLSGPFVDALASIAAKVPLYKFDAAIAGTLRPAIEGAGKR